MWFCKKEPTSVYEVVVHLDGRHPYLTSNELDHPSRDVVMVVPAHDWNDAQSVALTASGHLQSWRRYVKSMKRIDK